MTYKFNSHVIFIFILLSLLSCKTKRKGNPRVLVFSKTSGFHHPSIGEGNKAFIKLGLDNNIDIDTTTNADWFIEDSLKNYSAVVFINTSGDVLNHYQEADFERYIQAGGGFVGIHAASTTEYEWGWYTRLVGGTFKRHPHVQEATLEIKDKSHPSTSMLPETWTYIDEWYDFENINPDVNTLITIDESSYEGARQGGDHAIAWYHDYDGGRAFYTGLGHRDENYSDTLFMSHVLGGLKYAIGDNLELNYKKAKTARAPKEESFSKTTLVSGSLFEPIEMAILPNLDVLVAQRRGELMLYSQTTKEYKQVGYLPVYYKTKDPEIKAGEGIIGLTIDPDFKNNHFIYTLYSPIDTSVNRLSRFKFKDNEVDIASESTILEFYSQREICCHTGGSLAFGSDGLLYIATGDNSTPFNQPDQDFVIRGYAPLDFREGFEQYDAARTSANSNDLRGKIVRIKVTKDGGYTIPEGNLFPKGMPKTRPEIYTMGNRNPYRISIDAKTNFLYWGDVGPDATVDSLESRGPKGYDEINQAKEAGFYGWPFFVADNKAYYEYDFTTGKGLGKYEVNNPVNLSPNNTGIKELPSVKPAFIWYSYDQSNEFSQVGSGGRNSMTGPVYYPEYFPKETRYPNYYNGKLFIYDWMRNWIKVVSMKPNGDFDKMEPFMEGISLASPIDMEVGPDGRLYILEYGKGWRSKNRDAAISRIDYTTKKSTNSIDDLTEKGEKKTVEKEKSLILASDCQSCHHETNESVGPSYVEIASKYKNVAGAENLLVKKIIEGGSGVWGGDAMPSHPTLKEKEVHEMVKWIRSVE